MHSKIIIASLICTLAANFGSFKNENTVQRIKPITEETTCCSAPNEHHAYAYVSNERGSIVAGGWFEIITDIQIKNKAWNTITERDDPYSLLEGYFSYCGDLGVTINIPDDDGDYYIGFGINGGEVAKVYIFVRQGSASVSMLSKSDARAKYFMDYEATSTEKNILRGFAYGYSETTIFDAEKRYGNFVYGNNDVRTTLNCPKNNTPIMTQILTQPSVNINIHATWYDKNGAPHPLVGVKTEILSFASTPLLSAGEALLCPTQTNEDGEMGVRVSYERSTKIKLNQLKLRFTAINDAVKIDDNYGVDYTYCFSLEGVMPPRVSPTSYLNSFSSINYNISFYCGQSDRANAFEITQAERLPYTYCSDFTDGVSTCQVHYPSMDTHYSNNAGEGKAIRVRYDDFENWDVLNHEYGHHICDSLGLCSVTAMYKQHEINEDLTQRYNLEDALELAFSEGLATFIGIASQMYKTQDLNVPGVGDMVYQDSLRGVMANYEQESAGLSIGITNGEGIECCITSVLLKILTNESAHFDDALMWEALTAERSNNWYVTSLLDKIVEIGYSYRIKQIIKNEHFSLGYTLPYGMAEWTIMLYMCGSNIEYNPGAPGHPAGASAGEYPVYYNYPYFVGVTPEAYLRAISGNVKRILGVTGKPDNVNIIMETGGSAWWEDPTINSCTDGKRNKLNRFHVEKTSNGDGRLVYDDYMYGNMGTEEAFESFLRWGLKNYPARKTGIIFVGHGKGIEGVCPHEYTFYSDNYSEDERLYNELTSVEVDCALESVFDDFDINDKLEFVGYDACLMQLQDVAEFNSPYFKYMVGSQETAFMANIYSNSELTPGTSWLYDEWLDDLYYNPSIPTTSLLSNIVDNYVTRGFMGAGKIRTLSVLDLSQMENYYLKLENLAVSIKDVVHNNYPMFRNLIKQSYCFGDDDSGNVDGYQLLNILDTWDALSDYNIEISQAKQAYRSTIVYSRATDTNGYARNDLAHGLSSYIALDSGDYPMEYNNAYTHFSNWKKLVLNLS